MDPAGHAETALPRSVGDELGRFLAKLGAYLYSYLVGYPSILLSTILLTYPDCCLSKAPPSLPPSVSPLLFL